MSRGAKVAIGAGVGIFVIAALAVVIRRFRQKRRVSVVGGTNPIFANPMAFNHLQEEVSVSEVNPQIVQGIPMGTPVSLV